MLALINIKKIKQSLFCIKKFNILGAVKPLLMKPCLILPKILIALFFFSFSDRLLAQADYADKISSWKTQFPKEDVVALQSKKIVTFSLNANTTGKEGKVKDSVLNQLILVPVKDIFKYEDGLFYNDQISIDNIKAVNS